MVDLFGDGCVVEFEPRELFAAIEQAFGCDACIAWDRDGMVLTFDPKNDRLHVSRWIDDEGSPGVWSSGRTTFSGTRRDGLGAIIVDSQDLTKIRRRLVLIQDDADDLGFRWEEH